MKFFNNFCEYLSRITTIDKGIISLVLLTSFIVALFSLIKTISKRIIQITMSGRQEYVLSQSFRIILNILEVLALLLVWNEYIKNLMTLISVLSAAMTIALRDIILNFFCGIYIKIRKPFKVEDRIQIGDIKGDVMNISTLDFELLEVSTKEEHGQSTGTVISFPNSVVFDEPIKNINKGFKYVWDELVINVPVDCDLVKNKQEIYKIVNNLDIIKSIPKKMKSQINQINTNNRVYFNKYDPIIYTRIVDGHIELTLRYLMRPKKSRYVESDIWNRIYAAYQEGTIDLYIK